VTPPAIADAYELALEKALEILPTLVCYEVKDYRNEAKVQKGIRATMMSKQFGMEDFLTKLIAKACSKCVPL
jgi:T-complex protein 1 subunit theta